MILTVTFNPAIDHTYVLDKDLEDSKIARTNTSQFDAGGKGINVSTYLKALGEETVATGSLGGFTGEYIKSELDKQDLKHDFVKGGQTRINTTVLAGEKEYKINHDGPKTETAVVEKVITKIKDLNPETVVISGSLPPGLDHTAVERIMDQTESEITVDLSGEVLSQLEGDYFLAKPNETELSEATDIQVDSIDDARKASKLMLERGFKNILASLGDKGALLVTEDKELFVKGIPADVEDTTGAGDAILSGMLTGLKKGESKDDALEEALAFATIVVETPGTQIPELTKLEEYRDKAEAEQL